MRPGPRPAIAENLLEILREALLASKTIKIRYKSRITGRSSRPVVEPHGILFGQRHYLVAFPVGSRDSTPRLFALGNISEPTLTGDTFKPRQGFSLAQFAQRAFGIFQEDPEEIIWRFAAHRAADVMEQHFHPTEQKTTLADGSIEVRFTAGGTTEMAWHLFTWGPDVKVIAPDHLRRTYQDMLREALDGASSR
jgi:predicted DNA-binding transcriptional regulator YafY